MDTPILFMIYFFNEIAWSLIVLKLTVKCAVADLRGGVRDARPPSASKFFQFHAVFGRIRQNCVFTPPPPLEGSRPPPLGKSWIRH